MAHDGGKTVPQNPKKKQQEQSQRLRLYNIHPHSLSFRESINIVIHSFRLYFGVGRRKTTSHCKRVQMYFQQKTPIASNCDSIGQLEITHLKYLPTLQTDTTCISLNRITIHLNVDVTQLKISSDVPSILTKVQNGNRFYLIWYYVIIFFAFPLYFRCQYRFCFKILISMIQGNRFFFKKASMSHSQTNRLTQETQNTHLFVSVFIIYM